MPPINPDWAYGAILPLIGGVIWLVRLEGRVNGHDKSLTDVEDDVKYIRTRIDAALDARRERGEYL